MVVSLIAHNRYNVSIKVKVSVWFSDVLQDGGLEQKPSVYLAANQFLSFCREEMKRTLLCKCKMVAL